MLMIVTGGSGSGKSEFAEQCCMKLCPGEKIYIATMQPFGAEGAARIQRHKNLRTGKNFRTVECYTDLAGLDLNTDAQAIALENDMMKKKGFIQSGKTVASPVVLLECMSNLAANEMFTNMLDETQTVEKIMEGVRSMRTQAEHLVIVTNDVFCDGIVYDSQTVCYMKALAEINVQLAALADVVCEVVCGIQLFLKGNGLEYFSTLPGVSAVAYEGREKNRKREEGV